MMTYFTVVSEEEYYELMNNIYEKSVARFFTEVEGIPEYNIDNKFFAHTRDILYIDSNSSMLTYDSIELLHVRRKHKEYALLTNKAFLDKCIELHPKNFKLEVNRNNLKNILFTHTNLTSARILEIINLFRWD